MKAMNFWMRRKGEIGNSGVCRLDWACLMSLQGLVLLICKIPALQEIQSWYRRLSLGLPMLSTA